MTQSKTPIKFNPLSKEEALYWLQEGDLYSLLEKAKALREGLHNKDTYYVVNRQINPTNICVLSCAHCGFSRKPGQEGGWEMTPKEANDLLTGQESEVHVTGGMHPEWNLKSYIDLIRSIRKKIPNGCIKALTAVEVDYLSRKEKCSINTILATLKESGLDMLTGGGAEVFSNRLYSLYFKGKTGADKWIEVHRTAHLNGIPSNATMLFGIGENPEEIVQHMDLLRNLQDETEGFASFIPLALQPGKFPIFSNIPSPQYCLRVLSVARLFLHNFSHIKAYWVMLGIETALMALLIAADDFGGTVGKESVAHMSGAKTPEGLFEEQTRYFIQCAGLNPVKRDGFYRALSGG